MGYPMAGHLARHFTTAVWNRTPEVAARHAAEHGTRQAASIPDAVGADIVFSCVPTSREVNLLVDAALPALRPGSLWVDCTSGDPTMARATATRLAERGVTYLDAPVSGGRPGAESGTLSVMVGGDAAALERARPAIEAFSSRIVHVGAVGAGHMVKSVNNALMAVNLWAASEGVLALERGGVDLGAAMEVINASSGRSFATESLLAAGLGPDELQPWFKLALLHKDTAIASDVARNAGQPAPFLSLIVDMLGAARAGLGGEPDYRAIPRALRAWQKGILGRS
jgi:3-hydroxyisobutyrate dehydrogenase